MRRNEINVGMADLKVAKAPAVLYSLGIGSCVGIILYDSTTKVGGMAHIMLPDINLVKNRTNRAKFANTAIIDMIKQMVEAGAERRFIKAKIMGGAHMFGFASSSAVINIGARNIEKVKEVLGELRIRILAEDVGGSYGRSYIFILIPAR